MLCRQGRRVLQARLWTRMVQSIHAVLRNALECAVREETIRRNVAKLVKVTTPKYKVNRGLRTEQARAVLRAAAGNRLHALYVLALCLGLRRGELLGLRWEDIDLDGGMLEVVQTLQRVGGSLRFVRPKTEDSERTVPCHSPGSAWTLSANTRSGNSPSVPKLGPDWDDHGLVFPSRQGTPTEPDNLRRSWSTIRQAAGLGEARLHDCRHTCATLLLDLGVPPHVVRDIVGHSGIEVAMTIYAHVSLDEKRSILGRLGDALG